MAIYGIEFYGVGHYGGPVFVDLDASPFSVHAVGYDTLLVSWRTPTGAWDQLRLVRDTFGYPSTTDQGTILVDVAATTPTTSYLDVGLMSGSFYYYSIFLHSTADGSWVRAGNTTGLVVKDFGYADRLFSLTPWVFREMDAALPEATFSGDAGPLQRFFQLLGFQLDHIRTEYETLLSLNDPHKVAGGLLPLLASQYGVVWENELGMRLTRQQIRNAVHLYKTKGTSLGVEAFGSVMTGWDTTAVLGVNRMLDQNDSSFVQGLGRWAAFANCAPLTIKDVSVAPTFGPAVPAPAGSSTGNVGSGNNVMVMTALAAGDMEARCGQTLGNLVPITGAKVAFSGYVYAATSFRSVKVRVLWYDVAGNLLSTSDGTAVNDSTTAWTRVVYTGIAPTNAVWMGFSAVVIGAAAGGTHYWDAFQVEFGTVPLADDFTGASLNTTLWTVEDPVGNSTVAMDGTHASITVPAGSDHSASTPNNAARIVQAIGTADFAIDVKFDSAVTAVGQVQGVLIEQDSLNFLRVSTTFEGASQVVDATVVLNGLSTRLGHIVLGAPITGSIWFRINRQATTTWTLNYSTDGVGWSTYAQATLSLIPTKIGPYAANGTNGVSIPAFTALVDFFHVTTTVSGVQAWQSARDVRLLLKADRVNLVENSSVEASNGGSTFVPWTFATQPGWSAGSRIGGVTTHPDVGGSFVLRATETSTNVVTGPHVAWQTPLSGLQTTPEKTYLTASAYVICNDATTGIVKLYLSFYDVLGHPVTTLTGPAVPLVRGVWTRVSYTVVAPLGAVTAYLSVDLAPTGVLNNRYDIDGVMLERSAILLPYFDGSQYSAEGEYVWESTPGASRTHYYRRRQTKNFRLNQRMVDFLPSGATYTLLYADPSTVT